MLMRATHLDTKAEARAEAGAEAGADAGAEVVVTSFCLNIATRLCTKHLDELPAAVEFV